jgi:trk system potassium uptake protein TrkH
VGFLAYVWPPDRLRVLDHLRRHHPAELEVQVAALVAALFGLDAWLSMPAATEGSVCALTALFLVPVTLAWRRRVPNTRAQVALVVSAALLALAPVAVVLSTQLGGQALEGSLRYVAFGLLSPLSMLALASRRALRRRLRPATRSREPDLIDVVLNNPSRVLVVSFVGICALGTLLLALPIAAANGDPLAFMDALFMAVSATCVTGLVTVDTPVVFSGFGQAVVLTLIQVGGLGIMVFSAAAVVFLGKRMSLSHERAAVDLVGATGRAGLRGALRDVFVVTLATEGVAAVLLTGAFWSRGDSPLVALWRGSFTAISAFCNAGFALQSDSLISYADDPFVLGVLAVTIVVGGLGPSVVMALTVWRQVERRTLHTRLVLATTAALIVGPALLIAALEWNNTLAGMSALDKLGNALFQSVTLRTAGFNSIDLARVNPATWTLMILVMFVGGSPGSTAGGAKTTTLAVVVLSILAVARGRERIEVFGRTLPNVTVLRATAVTTLGVLASCVGLGCLQVTQDIPLDAALFEVVSALATVGLSVGATGMLDDIGKVVIAACMFAGRVGPLTLFVFLASASSARADRAFPEENVPVG